MPALRRRKSDRTASRSPQFAPAPAVVYAAPTRSRPSDGVAALLSLLIPGAGQMYKGRVGAGLVWLLFTMFGYLLLIVPGLFLHLICILHAASTEPR